MRSIDPDRDLPYQFDKWLANRLDGGTMSDTFSEALGVSKPTLHTGAVLVAAAPLAVSMVKRSTSPLGALLALAIVGVGAKIVYDYLETPRIPRY